jgi:predicted PurR-regulated permease PerM
MTSDFRFPAYFKISIILIGAYVFIYMLSIGQDIILPIIYAILIAILLSPLVNFLVKKKLNRGIAIGIVLLFAILIIVTLFLILSSQTTRLIEAWPKLAQKFNDLLGNFVKWVSAYFHISSSKIDSWISSTKKDMMSNSNAAIGMTITTIGGFMATVFLTPVYIFMILFYRVHILNFIHQLFGANNNKKIGDILKVSKTIVQSYLVGLFAEFSIIATLNSIGLLIIGLDYAVLLGIGGALLNVIPYLGGLVAVGIYMIIALITKSPDYVAYVAIMYFIIQLLDNNFIVPKVVGSKVKLNALISLLTVIAGAALWGIPGMFLSIPLTAILKVFCDRINGLKPFGYMLGNATDEGTGSILTKIKIPAILKRKKVSPSGKN